MSIEIHPDLKPLSANLKRLDIGVSLLEKEFEYMVEENNQDVLWTFAKKEWANEEGKYGYKVKDQYTGALILILNDMYIQYIYNNEDHGRKIVFNIFIKIALINYINTTSKPIEKVIQSLKTIKIADHVTILEIENHSTQKNISSITETFMYNKVGQNTVKKYQVFISSTYNDLKKERQAAVEAILRKGHIPAGMELFAANDKSQWEAIKKWIDDSDIYLLILGGRYGSIDKESGLSYTEMEYNYAINQNKPFFALVLEDELLYNKDTYILKDYDLKNPLYIKFKSLVTSKICRFPKNLEQIKIETNHSLDQIIKDSQDSLIGWVRGNNL